MNVLARLRNVQPTGDGNNTVTVDAAWFSPEGKFSDVSILVLPFPVTPDALTASLQDALATEVARATGESVVAGEVVVY